MGPDQLSSVMQTVSGKNKPVVEGEDRWKDLRTKIEAQSEATYSTARIWVSHLRTQNKADEQDDGIIEPSDTRDVLGLGLELAAEERASRDSSSGGRGGRGEIGADGDSGDWGVFRM
jgi:3-methylcrotonyl-CoA carboxylase beta subunit